MTTEHAAVRLQYWPPSHTVDAPDTWPDSYEFGSLDDAVAFAMTQAPAHREVAWLRTADGEVLKMPQIRRLWELRDEQ
ncbi:hypothetical protein [Ancylobacter mangrovi]|uniref:Uncharacterized protein n=1 Tax=Ancylobacter mangrovi TaxID=2972472 RepID=A0A9X2PDP1_9HYPH|nr:hypothetical protein [Ancylobacter mangrovi]MCS0496781.1 hypothetical protein [Ancylobacter mangrovi]MCS0504895.1 hypothetical protein [Ancylobacter mangrovi]